MPIKFYAVRVGRDGPKVYSSWRDADPAVGGLPGARHKSFLTEAEAQSWILLEGPDPSLIKRSIEPEFYSSNDPSSSSHEYQSQKKRRGQLCISLNISNCVFQVPN